MSAKRAQRTVAVISALEPTVRKPFRVWILAAIGAVALHTGALALALVTLQPEDAPDELGANAIEVGYERMSPHTEALDLPAGPEADASVASPAVAEQKAVVQDTDLPKAVPTETEEPDRIVTTEDKKKPVEEEPDTPATPTQATTGSVAAEATAVPSSETTITAERSVAPELGTGDAARRVRTTWQKELAAHLDKHKRYPADRANKGAEIVIGFELDRTGHVLAANVVKGSGDSSFDAAALAMIRRSDPVPPPPPLVADDGLSFTMPVIFHVKGHK